MRRSVWLLPVVSAWSAWGIAAGPAPGMLDRAVFSPLPESAAVRDGASETRSRLAVGDRVFDVRGVALPESGGSMEFALSPRGSGRLTLELREFRTCAGQSPAYVVSVGGVDVAFRCRHYDEAGLASAFLDLPDPPSDAPISILIRNVASSTLHLSEAVLYHDIEAYARAQGLWEPMYVGPTVRIGEELPERLRQIRALLPTSEDIRPMCVVATFAIGQWPRERIEENLDRLMAACAAAGMPAEIQLNTWWAGTPIGFDGLGGRWTDPEYQQITYDPDTRSFDLNVPNRWSSTPWLTVRHPRLNAFKARRFELAGRILRDRWERAAAAGGAELPAAGIVLDNEVTYWAAGMPDTPRNLQADFNPAMVTAARDEGVVLDPEDGLSEAEIGFLRRSLRTYNREMAAGLLRGLAGCPLADRVYTHTWVQGFGYDNPAQALEAGVLRDVRLGTECSYRDSADLGVMDGAREMGVPVMLNVELGHQKTACEEVPFAFATGCRRASLFNAGDELLRATTERLAAGWPEYRPAPWRRRVLDFDFEPGCRWADFFELDGAEVVEICPITRNGIQASAVDASGRALMHLEARELVGRDVFTRLSLSYKMRAFVWQAVSDDAYLAIRAGRSRDALVEVERLSNSSGVFQTDLTQIASGATDMYVEFELHPLVLQGWVALFDLAVEIPWQEEALLCPNRSYRADRLRAESLIVGWRADAAWQLQRLRDLGAPRFAPEVRDLEERLRSGAYPEVYRRAVEILQQQAAVADEFPAERRPDGDWRGEAAGPPRASVVFHPYEEGVVNVEIAMADGAEVAVFENGRKIESGVMAGDDLRLILRDGKVVRVEARRGTQAGRVARYTAATAFALPTLELEDGPGMAISSRAQVEGRDAVERRGSTWLRVGDRPFEPGDRVRMRWNPHTARIVEAVFERD